MQSLPMCAAWLILTSACLALLFVRTSPLESLFLLLLIIYAMQAFLAEALGIRVRKKSISFPRRSIPGFPFVVLWARAHRMRRYRPDKFAAQGASSCEQEHWRAPAVGFPKPPGAAAIFSIGQAGGSLDQHIRALGHAIVAVVIALRGRASRGR